jgi:putative copper export protein
LNAVIHTLHVLLAGAWLGGVIFTTIVVSPALQTMEWSEAERVRVRAIIGKRYAGVGGVNLSLLLVFALLDGLIAGFGILFYAEYVLLLVLFGLVAAHGAYFGRRLANLASAERKAESPKAAASFAERRRALQRTSSKVSVLDVVVSVAIMVLAING